MFVLIQAVFISYKFMEELHNVGKKTIKKKIAILIIIFAFFFLAAVAFKTNSNLAEFINNIKEGQGWFTPVLIISAAIDSINPCAFSVLLLTIAFLVNLGKDRSRILKIGGIYISGIFVMYVMIGLGMIRALDFFNVPHFAAKIGATLVILFGSIEVLGALIPRFPIKFGIPKRAHPILAKFIEKGSIPAAFILGVLVSVFEFPCTGGPYLTVLGLLRDKDFILGNYLRGAGYLIIYNVIFILPLIIMLLLASEKNLLEKVQMWKKEKMKSLNLWIGIIMILLGVVILFL